MKKPLAVISDIHGNIWALDAVLAYLRSRNIEQILDLGDSLYGPLDPAATWNRMMEWNIPSVMGNEDKILIDGERTSNPTLRFVLDRLPAEALAWIRGLPPVRKGKTWMAFHGSPESDIRYFLEEVRTGSARFRDEQELEECTRFPEANLFFCGHSHRPGMTEAPGGKTLINPGSVGLPAYDDDSPVYHRMETGSHHASCAIVTQEGGAIRTEFIRIPYDREKAADTAKRNGRPDWARWIRTGRA